MSDQAERIVWRLLFLAGFVWCVYAGHRAIGTELAAWTIAATLCVNGMRV